ncbi:MAG: translation initiation factor IF-2 [Candidatus Amulumruptor caecigallinarius]|nr:translation initiation factor IF-2 [Candidatus Amulumruptor caecigallinarius]MCM1395940.1 translation initiation factor IF-2 [Candidatus Amulumruptor caecigallinarius]MCM1452975.1 translation initiation factor IF-2 [bacterium]
MARTKISKAAKDFNISVQTAVEFLRKKNISIEDNPNAKIDEEAYDILAQEFKPDQALKSRSDRQTMDRRKEQAPAAPAPAPAAAPQEAPAIHRQIPKVLGKIDLRTGKPIVEQPAPAAPAPKPAEQPEGAEAPQATPKSQKPETKAPAAKQPEAEKPQTAAPAAQVQPSAAPAAKQEEPAKAAESAKPEASAKTAETAPAGTPAAPVAEPAKKPALPKAEEKLPAPAAETPAASAAPAASGTPEAAGDAAASTPAKKEEEIFTTGTPLPTPQLNIIGKIDLSAINAATRPKKKPKDAHKPGEAGGERRKRKRISGKERVDVEKTGQSVTSGAASSDRPRQGGGQGAGSGRGQGNGRGGQGRGGKRGQQHTEVREEDVQKQVKETLARLTSKDKGQKKGAKWRKEKREAFATRQHEAERAEAAEQQTLKLTEFVTANDLASMMDVPVNNVIATCMNLGVMVSINQRLDAETINIVAEEFGFKTEYVSAEVVEAIHQEEDAEEDLVNRPPIVTVMGHVDHGKTSLLDYIRKANVIAGEAGGITQHIGAYNVQLPDGRHITFLDTPGHEAFTAMRARGAKVTDIVIVIVAADDDVMPQTVEALNHASAAGVPIVFAINKIDKPAANPDKIKEELAGMNYLVEEWGGKYQSQDISAKKGTGVEELMDKVLLEAEMLELKANPNRNATGSIIESSLDKGRGYVATVLVSNGTLRVGDTILAGTHFGRVKAMFNERNQRITEAGPATPVLILGLNGAPTAGDTFNVMDSEQEAREIASKREQLQREQGMRTTKRLTLEDIGRRLAVGNFQELNVIVKGDVDGSIEALSDSLIKLSTPEIQVNVLHKAVGEISESDVTLAAASDAIIIGFQVRPSLAARRAAERDGVQIRLYSVIYQAIEEVKDAMEGMLAPELKEEVIGTAEVLQTYHISKVGTIAGAIVREGKIKRGAKVRLIRDGIVRYTGDLGSLKRFKDDVKEVLSGYDCGLSIAGYNDIQEGDMIEAFEEVEVKKSL